MLGRLQHGHSLAERLIAQRPDRLHQIHHALKLVQHRFQVAPVAQEPLEQPQQVAQIDVLLHFLELLDRQAERIIGDGHDIAHQLGARLALALGGLRLFGEILHLGGQKVELLAQLRDRREWLIHVVHPYFHLPDMLMRAGSGSSCPFRRMFQYIQRNIILPQ